MNNNHHHGNSATITTVDITRQQAVVIHLALSRALVDAQEALAAGDELAAFDIDVLTEALTASSAAILATI